MPEKKATSDNVRLWRSIQYGLMWLVLADDEKEAIELLLDLAQKP